MAKKENGEFSTDPMEKSESLETVELSESERSKAESQFKIEYQAADSHISPKRNVMYERLRLYNNSKRDLDKVGEPTLFTVMQTILAYVQEDRLQISFGDSANAKNRELVALSDYDEMDKQLLDYYWNWNTFFFGRACVLMMEFNRKQLMNKPSLIDPLILLRDPSGSCVNGDEYGRPVNYIGRPIRLSQYQYENSGLYSNLINKVNIGNWAGASADSLIGKATQVRDDVANRSNAAVNMDNVEGAGDNQEFEAFEMFTHFGGKKMFFTFAQIKDSQNKTDWKLIRSEGVKTPWFPIIDRACYPLPNDWDGVSVSDIVEDKQRVLAILTNLGLEAVVRELYPRFTFNKNKISGVQLKDPKQMGFPIDGDPNGVIVELPKGNPNMQMFDYMKGTLKDSSERATATSDIQQGVSGTQKTATEADLLATRGGVRYGLLAKIFGVSEREFWRQWYSGYKLYMTENDEKEISVLNDWGHGIKKLKKVDFISEEAEKLRIRVESKNVNETNRLKALGNFMPFYQAMAQRPNANTPYFDKKLAKLMGFDKDEIDMMLLPSSEEYIAEQENKLINTDKEPKIHASDDHATHLFVHATAADNNINKAHRAAHFEALALQRKDPSLFPVQQREKMEQQGNVGQGTTAGSSTQPQQTATGQGVTRAAENVPIQQNDANATREAIQQS